MVNNSVRRKELRPQGVMCPGCNGCQFHQDCGGYYTGRLFGNCFEETCCHFTGKDKALCNAVCPYKDDFDDWIKDTHGLKLDDFPQFVQPELDLPQYIPVIDHRSSRIKRLQWPIVALDTYKVFRIHRKTGDYQTIADTPSNLREAFLLADDCKVLLRGIAKDPPLERYWENRLLSNAPDQLKNLDIYSAIGPNFSHFLDVPRTDHIFNKRRQLLCLFELIDAGLPAIPHLNAVMPGDWWFWKKFLKVNSTIRFVAIEFQTGNKNPTQGRIAINNLVSIQNDLKRPLHPIIVGGTQFTELVAMHFRNFTLIDSNPFHKTMRRFNCDPSANKQPWKESYTLKGQMLDKRLADNIESYTLWLERRVRTARAKVRMN